VRSMSGLIQAPADSAISFKSQTVFHLRGRATNSMDPAQESPESGPNPLGRSEAKNAGTALAVRRPRASGQAACSNGIKKQANTPGNLQSVPH